MEGEQKTPFHLFHFPPNKFYLNLQFFSFDLIVLLYHGFKPLLMPFFPFLQSINYDCAPQCNKSFTPSLSIWFWLKIWPFSSPWNYGIAHGHLLRVVIRIVNEKPPPESSLDLTLTQHPHDEEPEPWEVHARLEVEPPWTWYYRIYPNSRTLVILLQVDFTSNDEPETVCEGYYEIKDIFIFAWSWVPGIGHYHWLRTIWFVDCLLIARWTT
jgi:hypothetical protein